jgi:hypothetical protein
MLDRGEVIRFISAAARPARRTTATMSDPRQILPREVPVARWTAAVVTSNASDLVSSLVVSLSTQGRDGLPVEIPLANDSCDCYFANSPDDPPSPEPSEGDERNEPSRVWADVEYPGIVATGHQLQSKAQDDLTYG